MLSATETAMPQWTAEAAPRRPGLPQVGQADGDDQEGFEPFAQRDDECLKHD